MWHFAPWQARVWRRTRRLEAPRFVFLSAGRGAGKDILAIRSILRDALKLYGRKKRRLARGEMREVLNPLVKVWVLASAQGHLDQAWADWRGELEALARYWAPLSGFEPHETSWLFREVVRERSYILFGRGELEIEMRVTSTKDNLRGPGVDLVHWTEFAMERTTGELHRAFRTELQGTITRAGRLGRVYTTTTPKGPHGGYYDELIKRFQGVRFQDVQCDGVFSGDGLSYYHHAEWHENDLLTPEQVAMIEAEKVYGWQYDQERLARFVIGDLGGSAAFKREWVSKCMVDFLTQRDGYRQILFGVDIARFGDDFTAYVGIDDSSGEIVHVERHAKKTGADIVADLQRLHSQYPGAHFYLDSTGHRGYIADFAPSWMPLTETQFSREKEKWVGGLTMLLQMGRIRIPDPETCGGLSGEMRDGLRQLLKEMLAFVRVVKSSGGIEFAHPPGENDDVLDALMMAVMRLAARMQETMGPDRTRDAIGSLIV